MYAQVIEGGTTPAQLGDMNRLVTDELIPALQDEPIWQVNAQPGPMTPARSPAPALSP